MILDGLLYFSGNSKGGSVTNVTATAQTDLPTVASGTVTSTNMLDLGISGLPTSANGGGARDIGIGDDPAMKILVLVTTALTGGTSLAVALQGAPDNGSGAAGSFTTMLSTAAITTANLIAGARLMDDDMPRPVPGQAIPRFLQLTYTTVGTYSAGALQCALVLDRHDLPEQSNAVLGGYPAGITVAN